MSINYDAIVEAYHDNADYAETGSIAKARAFVTACRRLLVLQPSESANRETTTRFDMKLIQQELEMARQWLAANDTSAADRASVTRADFRNFRG